MKLKIDKIQELIDGIDYMDKPSWFQYISFKNEDDKQTHYLRKAKNLYQASLIVDDVVSYYIKNCQGKTFDEIYKLLSYNMLDNGSYGFYLGIPYYKVYTIDEVCQEWLSSRLRYVQDKIEREAKKYTLLVGA